MAIVVNAMASLGILGLLVGYSTELAAINKFGALRGSFYEKAKGSPGC